MGLGRQADGVVLRRPQAPFRHSANRPARRSPQTPLKAYHRRCPISYAKAHGLKLPHPPPPLERTHYRSCNPSQRWGVPYCALLDSAYSGLPVGRFSVSGIAVTGGAEVSHAVPVDAAVKSPQ